MIEYTSGKANSEIQTENITAYKWNKKNETLIIYELWEVIDNNRDESFDDLYKLLKLYYSQKKVKSKAEIYKNENTIEITNRSIVFPNILIKKNLK